MRVGVAFAGYAMRRPTRVPDARGAAQRTFGKCGLQIAQLALGAAAGEDAILKCRNAGGVITAIFEPLQRIDQPAYDGFFPQDADNSAHNLPRQQSILWQVRRLVRSVWSMISFRQNG